MRPRVVGLDLQNPPLDPVIRFARRMGHGQNVKIITNGAINDAESIDFCRPKAPIGMFPAYQRKPIGIIEDGLFRLLDLFDEIGDDLSREGAFH